MFSLTTQRPKPPSYFSHWIQLIGQYSVIKSKYDCIAPSVFCLQWIFSWDVCKMIKMSHILFKEQFFFFFCFVVKCIDVILVHVLFENILHFCEPFHGKGSCAGEMWFWTLWAQVVNTFKSTFSTSKFVLWYKVFVVFVLKFHIVILCDRCSNSQIGMSCDSFMVKSKSWVNYLLAPFGRMQPRNIPVFHSHKYLLFPCLLQTWAACHIHYCSLAARF